MKQWKNYALHILSLCTLFGIDQWSKQLIQHSLTEYQTIDIIDSLFYITYVKNTGAGFSLFENSGLLFFGLITVVALVAMVVYYFKSKSKIIQWILVFILAGTIGNFYDRLVLGYVRDFIGVFIGGWAFPIFNMADIYITCGFVVLAWLTMKEEKEQQLWENKQS